MAQVATCSENILALGAFQILGVSTALRFTVDHAEYHTTYELGRKVFVKLKGLAIGYHYGHLSIGKAQGSGLENISSFLIEQHFVKSCEK